jgi:hypothetical protein
MRDPYGSIRSIPQTAIDRAFAKPNSRTRPGFGMPGVDTTEPPDDRVRRKAGSCGTSKRSADEEEKGMTVLSHPPIHDRPAALGLLGMAKAFEEDISEPAPIVVGKKRDTGKALEEAYRGKSKV